MSERRTNKYNARRVVDSDGAVFDSRLELRRWHELQLLERAGEIRALTRQPEFILEPRQVVGKGRTRRVLRVVRYFADFGYVELGSDRLIAEDVKGVETQVFRLKARLMASRFPDVDLRIVRDAGR